MADDAPKLHIDDDWKSEAAAEKEKLSAEVESTHGDMGPIPEASFAEIVQLLAYQAMIGLGGMRTPDGREVPPNFDMAKHHIDLLAILEQKTDGKLESQEKEMLNTTLYQLRMAYVEMVQHAASGKRGG